MDADTAVLAWGGSPTPTCAARSILLVGFSSRTNAGLTYSSHSNNTPAWKRLVDHSPGLDERISLITDVFSSRNETEAVRHLCGEDAQSFVDLVDEVWPSPFTLAEQTC